ncbi:hypothetical protein BEWA_026630 [Theileria equi strain WA]|uniref:Signal peptide containing protein n=1 Tax=Theileria equi strain WA TaxID=1537102 RepID=L0AY25_THEEQ|nr:hypothetical protein BEWA_026630 [Theileria equi strain WA]AFZ79814.1 hypothetical protein BEWA_026630 [Theileria equi strain WA]|eukprot:XP_004829480.1 hypothetical protein BEWA_026630 [Theileria equi strain WA]
MRLIILLPIIATVKLCSAIWPWRLSSSGSYDFENPESSEIEGTPGTLTLLEDSDNNVFEGEGASGGAHTSRDSQDDACTEERRFRVPPVNLTSPITIELANPDDEYVKTCQKERDGILYQGFKSKDPYYFSSIRERGVEVWRARNAERCTLIKLYTKGDLSMMYLNINEFQDFTPLHLENAGDGWRVVDKEEFLRTFNSLRGDSADSPTS